MTRRLIATALLSLALTAPFAAQAGLVTWELEGTINDVSPYEIVENPYFPGGAPSRVEAPELIALLESIGVAPGASWSARMVFDSDTPAEPCGGCDDDAEFRNATKSIVFSVGGFAAATPDGVDGNASSLWFTNEVFGVIHSHAYLTFRSPLAAGSSELLADSMFFNLVSGHPGGVFSTSLPTQPPDLDGVSTDVVMFGRGFAPDEEEILFQIQANITSITPVPEPSLALLLLGAGGVALARRRRR